MPISLSQLLAWNPWLGTSSKVDDCTKALYAKLEPYGTRAVCIGVGSTSSVPGTAESKTKTKTKTPTKTSVSAPSSTTSGGPPAPTQTGIVKGCRQFYVVQSGDICDSVIKKYGITFAQFLSWNPSGKFCDFSFLLFL